MMFFVSCSSSTMIETNPPGAKVFIDNAYAGQSPILMNDYKFSTTCTYIRIEKDGYETIETDICKDEEIDFGAAIGGLFFYIPWLWILEYYPVHSYILNPTESNFAQNISNDDEDNSYFYEEDNFNAQAPVEEQQNPKASKLRELKQLYDEGILSQDEYETEKKKILKEEEW